MAASKWSRISKLFVRYIHNKNESNRLKVRPGYCLQRGSTNYSGYESHLRTCYTLSKNTAPARKAYCIKRLKV